MRLQHVRHLLAGVATVLPGMSGATFLFAPVAVVRETAGDILSTAERARIAAFRQPTERSRRAAAHTLKRLMLARLLGVEPACVPCGGGGAGPPVVVGRSDIAVTLTHSGGWVGAGVGLCGSIGIDVELKEGAVPWPTLPDPMRRSDAGEVPAMNIADWCRLEARVKQAGGWHDLRSCVEVESLDLDTDHVAAVATPSGIAARIVIAAPLDCERNYRCSRPGTDG